MEESSVEDSEITMKEEPESTAEDSEITMKEEPESTAEDSEITIKEELESTVEDSEITIKEEPLEVDTNEAAFPRMSNNSNSEEDDYGTEMDAQESNESWKLTCEENQDIQQCWIKQETSEDFANEDIDSQVKVNVNKPRSEKTYPVTIKTLRCEFCHRKYESSKTLEQHIHEVHATIRSFSCSECPKAFRKSGQLRAHLRRVHSIETTFDCTSCIKTFQSANDLKTHMQEYHKTVFCSPCGKKFNGSGFLKEHVNLCHNSEEPRMCQVCGKSYTGLDAYLQHDRQHLDRLEKCFNCHICSKVYKDECDLKTHLKRHTKTHVNYNCDICEQSFKTLQGFTFHRYKKHNIKVTCEMCGKSFRNTTELNKHSKVHNVRQYQCDCGQKYETETALQGHLKFHSIPPYRSCEQCDSVFPAVVNLRSHVFYLHRSEQNTDSTL